MTWPEVAKAAIEALVVIVFICAVTGYHPFRKDDD